MPKEVVWSPLSENDFAGILEYLNENWDEKVANQFIVLTENILGRFLLIRDNFQSFTKKEKSESA